MKAEKLDLSELYPSKDEILSDFLMNYGAKLAGGDHAGGLESGIAAVSGRKKERRTLQQAEKIANLKSQQEMKKQTSDNLYRSGDLAVRQIMATTDTLEEKGRSLRALLDGMQRNLIRPTFKLEIGGDAALKEYQQRAIDIENWLYAHAKQLNRSSGGIASIR